MLIEGILRGLGLWDPPPCPLVRGPPELVGEGAGPDVGDARQLVPFLENSAFPDYGAGEGDFRN